jgi:hypothetical protein
MLAAAVFGIDDLSRYIKTKRATTAIQGGKEQ